MTVAKLSFVVPGDPATRTGGFVYDARIIEGLAALGWSVSTVALHDGWPRPSQDAYRHALSALDGLPDRALTVVDGLALGVLPDAAERHADRLCLVGLIHHPLADETGLTASDRAALMASETRALAAVRRVITTSATTASGLAAYGVGADRIGTVRPGVAPAPVSAGSGGGSTVLLCVATLTPRKGHALLIDALARLRHRPWRLVCAGSTTRDAATAAAIDRQIRSLGLTDRIERVGEVGEAELDRLYDRSDVLVLPSYHEGFGMVVVEAVARGLPVIASDAGAIPEALPADCGVLVPPGDVAAWTAALDHLLADPAARGALAESARRVRPSLPSWDDAARAFARELERVGL